MPPLLCNLDKINKLEDFDSLPLARLLWQYSTQSNRIQKASLTDVQVIHLSLLCRHAHKSHVLIVPLLGVMVLSDAPNASPLPLSSTSPFLPLLSFSPSLSLYPHHRWKQVPTEDACISLADISPARMGAGVRERESSEEGRTLKKMQLLPHSILTHHWASLKRGVDTCCYFSSHRFAVLF